MMDLFRIIFKVEENEVDFEDPRRLESYADFDAVIDAQGELEILDHCGRGGHLALNEAQYQHLIFKRWPVKSLFSS